MSINKKNIFIILFRPIYRLFYKRIYKIFTMILHDYMRNHLMIYLDSINNTNEYVLDLLFKKECIPIYKNEKIRIVFLFQSPSAWPSWESVWENIINDTRFEVKMILFNRVIEEESFMIGAQEFLGKKNISFIVADKFDFYNYKPHIIVYQTPWDDIHRPHYLRSDQMKKNGIRIAYIPYGIEYSDSVNDGYKFSNNSFKTKPWRMYTISEQMKYEHLLKSKQGSDHIAITGHPKFDSINNIGKYRLSREYNEKINKRKVICWLMHFPISINNKNPLPNINEYVKFSKKIKEYSDIFIFVRPHPKFFDEYCELGYKKEIKYFRNYISESENACFYLDYDYRYAMYNSNYIIGDRSALLIEAAAMQIPVLYMTNDTFKEDILPAVKPILDSYYQGCTCYDIQKFIEMVIINKIDDKKEERLEAKIRCLPYIDGLCGKRIINDLAETIYKEIS